MVGGGRVDLFGVLLKSKSHRTVSYIHFHVENKTIRSEPISSQFFYSVLFCSPHSKSCPRKVTLIWDFENWLNNMSHCIASYFYFIFFALPDFKILYDCVMFFQNFFLLFSLFFLLVFF